MKGALSSTDPSLFVRKKIIKRIINWNSSEKSAETMLVKNGTDLSSLFPYGKKLVSFLNAEARIILPSIARRNLKFTNEYAKNNVNNVIKTMAKKIHDFCSYKVIGPNKPIMKERC